MENIISGQVFHAPWPLCHTVIVMYFTPKDKWILLSAPFPCADHEGTALMPCCYERKDRKEGDYDPFYTQEELQAKLKTWELTDKRLRLVDEDYNIVGM